MQFQIIKSLQELDAREWNGLSSNYPFLDYAFMQGMEQFDCVGESVGWIPQHLVMRSSDNQIVAALPLYIKDNSYGELVFDWAWADAFHRLGLPYYPKLVCAIPYTPATGPRILTHDPMHAKPLLNALLEHAQKLSVSSIHLLFPRAADHPHLDDAGFLMRNDCQFQWINLHYQDFDDFLAGLKNKKRKQIRRERRLVAEANIEIKVFKGSELEQQHWHWVNQFYQITFIRKGGLPTFNQDFFHHIGEQRPEQFVVFFAFHKGEAIAASICYQSQDTLYGRHWGCRQDYNQLHFELCYYQGIEYCIKHRLQRFEPGAQGEHKLARGFLPVKTHSFHWLQHGAMQNSIRGYLQHERMMMTDYIDTLWSHNPYKLDREQLQSALNSGYYA